MPRKILSVGRVLLPEDWHPSLGEAPEVLAEWSLSNTGNAAETGTGALLARSLSDVAPRIILDGGLESTVD